VDGSKLLPVKKFDHVVEQVVAPSEGPATPPTASDVATQITKMEVIRRHPMPRFRVTHRRNEERW
jgi:hypothetical protein